MGLNLTIDPDVFSHAHKLGDQPCPDCLWQLQNLERYKMQYTLTFDDGAKKVLYPRYRQLIKKHSHFKNTAIQLLSKLLESRSKLLVNPVKLLPSDVPTGCTNPLDQLFLGMAIQQSRTKSNSGLFVLTTSSQNGTGCCLHDLSIKTKAEAEIDGLNIKYTHNQTSVKKWHKALLNEDQHVHLFENRTGHLLGKRFGVFCAPTEIQNEQIDVYGCTRRSKTRDIYVGECKLRVKNNESTLIKQGCVNEQLRRKIEAVRVQEEQCGRTDFTIKAFVISNADDMKAYAWEAVGSLGVEFTYVKINMPKGWQKNPTWTISDDDLQMEPYLGQHYLDTETGKILLVTDWVKGEARKFDDPAAIEDQTFRLAWYRLWQDGEVGAELPEAEEKIMTQQADAYLKRFLIVPQADSREAYHDMVDFANTVANPHLCKILEVALILEVAPNGRGPFCRFKDALLRYPQERERWFAYSAQCWRVRIDDLLKMEGLLADT